MAGEKNPKRYNQRQETKHLYEIHDNIICAIT